jgi:hypothetical protein
MHWMSPSKMQGTRNLMVWCIIWGNKIVGPVFSDTTLNAEMYLNMLQHMIMPSLLKNFRRTFSKMGHHLIMVSARSDGLISSFQVPELVAVVLRSGLRVPQISAH